MANTYRTERAKQGKENAKLRREADKALSEGRMVWFLTGCICFETVELAKAAIVQAHNEGREAEILEAL